MISAKSTSPEIALISPSTLGHAISLICMRDPDVTEIVRSGVGLGPER